LSNAPDAVPEGGSIEVIITDPTFKVTPDGDAAFSFSVVRKFANGTEIHGFLPENQYILVDFASTSFSANDMFVLYRIDGGVAVNHQDECNAQLDPDVVAAYVDPPGVWRAPICHTSDFAVAFDADGGDEKGKVDKKKKKAKAAEPTKPKTPGKTPSGPKTPKPDAKGKVEAKDAKGKKLGLGLGVGLGVGAGVLVTGAIVVCARKQISKKKARKSKAPKAPVASAKTDVGIHV
jgi:hypothetical protein